jgi:hypothetical protein
LACSNISLATKAIKNCTDKYISRQERSGESAMKRTDSIVTAKTPPPPPAHTQGSQNSSFSSHLSQPVLKNK